jgi:hypothetical protein
MRLGYLTLLAALLSFVGSLFYLFTGNVAVGVVWLAISLVWLAAGFYALTRSSEIEEFPLRCLARRFSRLLMFFGVL